ncbi:polysaccharide lyase 6 family protein [Wenyingzhuangia aestuarii]|uniref:polysaccharide lyase 6 family protein n=1 Tax=Wenyingzhuangia aestuarii TaxID=1647582 RepID=UPI00143AA625|nr:polysaccharide lyase 6 family protein [Wenyingzhuangia aestuarii]NJB82887.1 poly(beta-D-mannuronate) lyase [Wenyingzhuangia aestuarii]
MYKIKYFLVLASIMLLACKSGKSDNLNIIKTVEAFHQKVSEAKPGDEIVLANGVWENAELLFEANGTAENPIVLRAEESGKVTLEGNSNLRIAGSHLVIKGLVFKNGFTPTTEVISFRKDSKTLANNCRLTECVIDSYNNPERHDTETWLALYGKNNRVDHNHLQGKNTKGVTMIVRLNSKESQENNHRIDHNYFGPRAVLGANGGETLRIGTSHYSLTNSKTIVENNFFDRCNGEHENISNKSCQNVYKNNVFYECRGTLTMRHGNETWVEGNVFIGNQKACTGGIRVINGQQTVVNNYAIGLTGNRFRGAFVIMNGVPNSKINRYHQVKDAKVVNNTFINCDNVQLCAGSDAERSATPESSIVQNNIFYNENKDNVFTAYDDISGIAFTNNIISPNIKPLTNDGFRKEKLVLVKNKLGLLVPKDESLNVGATIKEMVSKAETGVSWYPKKDKDVAFASGNTIKVKAGLNTLIEAAINSQAGDVLELDENETYIVNKTVAVTHPLTVKSSGAKKPLVLFEKKVLFQIQNNGALQLEGLQIDGKNSPDDTGNSVISTSKYSMNTNYKLLVDNCDFLNLDINYAFDAVKVYKNTFADTISITNSKFNDVTGSIMALDKETDDIGIYNAEYVILKNNIYKNVGGTVLNLYRGGTDESTYGPFLELENSVFDNVGNNKRNKAKSAITLYGVQKAQIKNNIFKNSKGVNMHLVVGEPVVEVYNNNFYKSGDLNITGDEKYDVKNVWKLDPKLTENYTLSATSPLKNKGTDRQDLGVKQ